jgi:hypothetical protein
MGADQRGDAPPIPCRSSSEACAAGAARTLKKRTRRSPRNPRPGTPDTVSFLCHWPGTATGAFLPHPADDASEPAQASANVRRLPPRIMSTGRPCRAGWRRPRREARWRHAAHADRAPPQRNPFSPVTPITSISLDLPRRLHGAGKFFISALPVGQGRIEGLGAQALQGRFIAQSDAATLDGEGDQPLAFQFRERA